MPTWTIELDENPTYEDLMHAWEAGYTACHNDSIKNTVTQNPYEEN